MSTSPKAMLFSGFLPESLKKNPVDPVNPVYCFNKNRIHSINLLFTDLIR
jgi:hypothetical protein